MSRCLNVVDFQSLDAGTLSNHDADSAQAHLSECELCRSAFDRFRSDQTVARTPPPRATETQTAPRRAASDSSPVVRAARNFPRIDGYQITAKLGQGGMGVVYRAVQTKLDRVVALKVLPAIVADPPAVERFRREAKSAARLHHTNIVPIYDFGESHDGHFYAMELIEGRPLNELIQTFATQNITTASPTQLVSLLRHGTSGTDLSGDKSRDGSSGSISGSITSSSTGRGRAYYRQVARWMADAAEALNYAHGQGIIHRDIKPGNMILSADGRLMITDFGLAKTQEDTSISVVGALVGAIRYLSPEQAMAGRLQLDHRTDIWSLGATLYELLTFVPAFPGTDEKQILSAIITKDPVSLRKLDAHVPTELETICLKALEKAPDHRYPTAQALAEDLHRWLNDVPIEAKRPGPLRRLAKFSRRHRALTTAFAFIILVSVLLWGFRVTSSGLKAAKLVADGKVAERDADWALAADLYRDALTWRPNNADILFNVARALQEQFDRRPIGKEKVAEALEYCERAQQLKPDLTNIRNTYGVLLSMNDRVDDAITEFKKDLFEGRPAAHVYSNVAAVYFLAGDDKKAFEALKEATENPARPRDKKNGEWEPVPYYHGYHELATFQLLHRNPAALETISRGIDLKPEGDNHFGYHLVCARILLTAPDVRDDVQGYAEARIADGLFREKHPDPLIKRYLALGHLRARKLESARHAIDRAIEAQDLPVFTHMLTALLEAKSGNADAARTALAKAEVERPPDLKTSGQTQRSRHLGMIWFESADELNQLKQEVTSLLP